MAKAGKYGNTPKQDSIQKFQDESADFNERALTSSKQSTKNVGGHRGTNSKPSDMPSKQLAK